MNDFVARLGRVDSCAVSDALDKLGLKGAVTGLHRFSTERQIAGRVVTVKLERDEGHPATHPNAGAALGAPATHPNAGAALGAPATRRHLGTAAIEAAQQGDVIVIEQRTGIDAAGWGGNLSLGAKLRGVGGVIVEGPTRDVDQGRLHDFPVFARDHTSRTARGRIVEAGTNVPVTIGDVLVSPGDYVIADGSAVVFVTQGDIERVLETAEAVAKRERAMVDSLLEGTPISQVMGTSYESMLKRGIG
jgi:4-hydroxy-4-methyl-2-oxoglutarate aldolase